MTTKHRGSGSPFVMVTKPQDLLGKNLVGGLLELRGETLIEVEVPPLDAQRFDVWYVPDAVKQQAAPVFGGVLAVIAQSSAVIEIWSDRVDEREFHDSYDKRHAWWRVLETRGNAGCPRPSLWHLTAGRPNLVLQRFGFQQVEGSSGYYRTGHPGWEVDLVVIRELPKTRETLLLRLLGGKPVREEAMHELDALPKDAWENLLAGTWLDRLQLRLRTMVLRPNDPATESLMTLLEWGRERNRQLRQEGKQEAEQEFMRERARLFEAEQEFMRERARLFERRLGRVLSSGELETLTIRVRELGPERVVDIALDSSPAELEAWLEG